jgi:DNA-binding response OmpR family regulator
MKPVPMSHRVLLVTHQYHLANGLRAVLRHAGYMVEWAEGPEAALQVLEKEAPDVVLADLERTSKGGTEFVRRILRDDRKTRVVVMVERAAFTPAAAAELAAADASVIKPFRFDDLVSALRTAMNHPDPARCRSHE